MTPGEAGVAEFGEVRFGETAIRFEVRRSARRRKTVRIRVEEGRVLAAAPETMPTEEIGAIVRRRAGWIRRRLAAPGPEAEPAPKRFVSGETLPYLGRSVRLVVERGAGAPAVRFDHWRLRVAVGDGDSDGDGGVVGGALGDAGGERRERVRRAVRDWFRERAADRAGASVRRWLPRFGRSEAPEVLIRDQRKRWGSCAPGGALRFNWRVVMLPPRLLDYVVAHEIAHLAVPNHSPAFWSHLASAMPDWRERRGRLREVGATLPSLS